MSTIVNQSLSSIDQLEQTLVNGELMIGAIRAAQAEALAAVDEAQIARIDGARTLQDWVAARLDVTQDTAHTLVEAAKALAEHPESARALAAAEVTFDRAAATAKLAVSGASSRVLEASRGYDLSGVARLAARHRRFDRRREHSSFRDRYLTIQPSLDDATWRLAGQMPATDGRVVEAALDRRADTFPRAPGQGRSQRRVDALTSIALDSLGDSKPGSTGVSPVVTVFVDAERASATRGEAGAQIVAGPRVGPETLDRMMCDGSVQVVATDGLRPIAASATTRVIPPAVRRFVLHRDGACVVDGCNSRHRLQPHHIVPRSRGGGHSADNLATLCWYHHHVAVHGNGFRIDPESPPQRRRLLPPRAGPDPP